MEFRLTYAGKLRAHKRGVSGHVHDIRQRFHEQLKSLWNEHPVLGRDQPLVSVDPKAKTFVGRIFSQNGYNWKPIVTEDNALVCELEVLMLRKGPPGNVRTDIDNRLKTLFDALRIASPEELRNQSPRPGQNPFYALLQDDRLITRVSVASDMLLERVEGVERDEDAVRLVIGVRVRPYKLLVDTLEFAGS